jgi:glycosyltransferase involved in cell wall biosynthesis
MRILSVTASYWPFLEFGGPPVKVRALATGLARHGHAVTVLTADWGFSAGAAANAGEGKAERCPFGWRYIEQDVQAIYLPMWLRYRALSWNPAVKRYCRARLKNFDIVHIFGLYDLLGPAVAAACRRRNLPYILEPIGMFVPIVRNLFLKRLYHAAYGRGLFQGARAIIATSEQEVRELSAGGVERGRIVLRRNGVAAPASWPEPGALRRAHGIAPDAKLVLFLGRLSEKKSPELLLRSVAALPAQLEEKNVQLLFVGPDEGGMKSRLEKMAAQLRVRSRVHFSGPLFGEAKWGAYRDADVFVLPSQNENFGNTAAEAAVAGTPVIVTEQCGIAPLLADRAGLVVQQEERALAQSMKRVLAEPGLHERLAAGCSAVAAQLGWEEPVQEMEALYARLVAKPGEAAGAMPVE